MSWRDKARRDREFNEAEDHWTRIGDVMGLGEGGVMESSSPFAGVAEPPDPEVDELSQEVTEAADLSESDTQNLPGGRRSDDLEGGRTSTPIRFPVVVSDAAGQPLPIPLSALEGPAERLANLIEAIQSALVPPPVIAELEALVEKANALQVTDGESMKGCSDLYEQLHANEKGIEQTIGPVVGFFHRPHQAMTKFRARFAGPVADAKKRLSTIGGQWTLQEKRRAEEDQRQREQKEKKDEQDRLRKLAETAKAAGDTQTAAVVEQMVDEVTSPALALQTTAPTMPTKSRATYVVDQIDELALHRGIADGTIPLCAAPPDLGYLNRQAKDLGTDMPKRFPGVSVKEKGGLTANGRR